MRIVKRIIIAALGISGAVCLAREERALSVAEYQDQTRAAWTGQILGTLLGFPFEHRPAAVRFVDDFAAEYRSAPADDDYFYELVALRGFEKYGIGMTERQLGEQWLENNAGAWGSSEQALSLLKRGVRPPETGHPLRNRLWFTIGPQFSADIYGMIAPAHPNLAARLARKYGSINGYAEGLDGAVFIAGMVSIAYTETDSKAVVKKAAGLIDRSSPYRQCIDQVISMAEGGKSPAEIAEAVEERWHREYPATNNAVANGGLVALAVWFGEGDYLKTINVALRAADFTDADCNAANAGAVVGAMRGMKALPARLVERLGDRMTGSEMGGVPIVPPIDESVSAMAARIAVVGQKMLAANGGRLGEGTILVPVERIEPLPPQTFSAAEFAVAWNPAWKLERAGLGAAGGGIRGIRGGTSLEGDVLATYPRDEVRGAVLRRSLKLSTQPELSLEVGADAGRAWELDIWVNNKVMFSRVIEGYRSPRQWQTVRVDLASFAGQDVEIRMFQKVLIDFNSPGNAYWRNVEVH